MQGGCSPGGRGVAANLWGGHWAQGHGSSGEVTGFGSPGHRVGVTGWQGRDQPRVEERAQHRRRVQAAPRASFRQLEPALRYLIPDPTQRQAHSRRLIHVGRTSSGASVGWGCGRLTWGSCHALAVGLPARQSSPPRPPSSPPASPSPLTPGTRGSVGWGEAGARASLAGWTRGAPAAPRGVGRQHTDPSVGHGGQAPEDTAVSDQVGAMRGSAGGGRGPQTLRVVRPRGGQGGQAALAPGCSHRNQQ